MNAHDHDPEVPDIVLERYRLNELPRDEADRLDDLLRRHEPLRQRLDALARSDEDILRSGALERIAGGIPQRLAGRDGTSSPGPGRLRLFWTVPAVVVALATVLVAVMPRMAAPPTTGSSGMKTSPDAGDRIKGLRPALAVYRRTADGSETLADGAVARRGDVVRVGYRAAGRTYGVIFSIDGRGSVTRHLPAAGDAAAALGRDATVLLDQAYELDDAPMWERFYFVTAEAPFAVAPILDAARRAAATLNQSSPAELALPHGLDQSTFSLQKEARP